MFKQAVRISILAALCVDTILGCAAWQSVLALQSRTAKMPDKRDRTPSLDQARAFADAKNWNKAVEAYRRIIARTPANGQAWSELGNALLRSEAYVSAIEAYKKAAELNYEKDINFYNIARAYAATPDGKDEAFRWLKKAVVVGFHYPFGFLHKSIRSLSSDPRWNDVFPNPTARYPELSQPTMATRIMRGVKMAMRDGAWLVADIALPAAEGKYPAILVRSPYNRKTEFEAQNWSFWASRGYAFVSQDVRGRFDSGGVFEPMVNERKDGYDTIDWISKQSWSNGSVGMIGGSYLGSVQWSAAAELPPALKCIIPQVAGSDPFFSNGPYDHGVFGISNVEWAGVVVGNAKSPYDDKKLTTLPLSKVDDEYLGVNVPFFDHWLEMDTPAAFSRANFVSDFKNVHIPALNISGWWDGDTVGTNENWAAMRALGRTNQWLIYGPWVHNFNTAASIGDMYYGPQATIEIDSLYVRWFDTWLKGKEVGLMNEPKVRVFVTGANEWRFFDQWPEPESRTMTLLLGSLQPVKESRTPGELSSERPKSRGADTMTYDPGKVTADWDPLPYAWRGTTVVKVGHSENGVLLYRASRLEHEIELGGPIELELFFSTTGRDIDFFASLLDIDEKGIMRVINQPGKIRARYLSGWDNPKPLTPGKIYKAKIVLCDVAHRFEKGHRIGLLLRNHMFPLFARNLNTGEPIKDATRMVVARQSIYHDPSHPSSLTFRILR